MNTIWPSREAPDHATRVLGLLCQEVPVDPLFEFAPLNPPWVQKSPTVQLVLPLVRFSKPQNDCLSTNEVGQLLGAT